MQNPLSFADLSGYWPLIRTILIISVSIIVFNILLNLTKIALLKRITAKKQVSNIKIFSRVLSYTFFVVLVIAAISSYTDNWLGFGLGMGLASAALGWALQRPITGVAAWIMVVVKRPFEIGDRILIGADRGDVLDISLTHVYIGEIGGIIGGEERSGRVVMIPNAVLFDQNINNYTYAKDEYVLDQVSFTITFDSNLDKACRIVLSAAKDLTADIIRKTKREPLVRTYFQTNGINVLVRYMSPAKNLQQFSSDVTKAIYDKIMTSKDIRFAYNQQEVHMVR